MPNKMSTEQLRNKQTQTQHKQKTQNNTVTVINNKAREHNNTSAHANHKTQT